MGCCRSFAKAFALLALCLAAGSGQAEAESSGLSSGQTLYLPVYSHIWYGERMPSHGEPQSALLSSLVSVRNTSPVAAITLRSARYYDTHGQLLREYVAKPQRIAPLATFEVFVEQRDKSGGSGANFVLEWSAEQATNPPVVEAVHAHLQGSQTLTFVSTARVIDPTK